jgi:ParB-like chromosome segregation protein Spo0J
MKIEQRKVESLIPYVNNSRTHSDEQVAQIAASIKEFGFTNPILIDGTNGIIAGHGRLMAARKLSLDTVPCIQLSHLSDKQRKAYILADNRLAMNSGWDTQLLTLELKGLDDEGFDLEMLGFDVNELAKLFDENEDEKDLKEISYSEVFNIVIECANESEQEKIFNRLDTEGYKCRVQSL